jgi:hypothetical protein
MSVPYQTPAILPSGATFTQLQSGGLAAILDLIVAANPTVANPTVAPTVNPTGGGASGGTLPAGTYFVSYAWDSGIGRTLPKESAASFVVAAGNIPTVTVPALPAGVASAHVYLTQAGGASGSEVFYGVTTGITLNLSTSAYADPAAGMPTVNATGLAIVAGLLNLPRNAKADQFYGNLANGLSNWTHGDPMDQSSALNRLRQLSGVFRALWQATDDAVALCFANTGSLHQVMTGPERRASTVRTFP